MLISLSYVVSDSHGIKPFKHISLVTRMKSSQPIFSLSNQRMKNKKVSGIFDYSFFSVDFPFSIMDFGSAIARKIL